ncbi:MAG TPA: farnesyl-diphosphate synthase, partial [Rhodospirillaceae bacterium]|nr:farnesyl-diphosphate synthase [Rhodospirillaceae bacterium]
MTDLARAMSDFAGHLEDVLNKLLPLDNAPERDLLEAMRYATLDGGKRVRPFLVNET